MIIDNLIKIANIDKNITRIKQHKFTQEEQTKINNIVKETNKKINIDNFIKDIQNILKGV